MGKRNGRSVAQIYSANISILPKFATIVLNMLDMRTTPLAISALLVFSMSTIAGPVKTIAWNGHKGAVSFTYDDARPNQLTNAIPQLNNRGIKATFNVSKNWDFTNSVGSWIQVAQNGHEVTNHTTNHNDLTNLPDSAAVAQDVATHANYLRGLNASIEAVTLAYPYCASSATVDKGTSSQNFIARTCGGNAQFSWGSQPGNWMQMTSYIMQPNTAAGALSQLDDAKNNNTWFVVLMHGVVDGSSDQYDITPAQQNAVLDRAVQNQLWMDTYQNVGAYYRASFTMDAVQAQTTGTGWRMAWASPHSRMPRSVLLRVNLDAATFGSGFTVLQNGQEIPQQADGSYLVDFMKLSLDVEKAGMSSFAPLLSSSSDALASSSSDATSQILSQNTWRASVAEYRVYDLFGKLYVRGAELPRNLRPGMWLVKAFDAHGRVVRRWATK